MSWDFDGADGWSGRATGQSGSGSDDETPKAPHLGERGVSEFQFGESGVLKFRVSARWGGNLTIIPGRQIGCAVGSQAGRRGLCKTGFHQDVIAKKLVSHWTPSATGIDLAVYRSRLLVVKGGCWHPRRPSGAHFNLNYE